MSEHLASFEPCRGKCGEYTAAGCGLYTPARTQRTPSAHVSQVTRLQHVVDLASFWESPATLVLFAFISE